VRAWSQPHDAPAHAALILSSTYTRASQTNRVEGAKRRTQPPRPGRLRLVIRASTTAIQHCSEGRPELHWTKPSSHGWSGCQRSYAASPPGFECDTSLNTMPGTVSPYGLSKKKLHWTIALGGTYMLFFLLKKTLGLKMVAVAPSPTFRNRMTGREVQNVQLARGVVVVCSSKLLGVAQKRVVLCPFPVLPSAFVKSTRTESFSRLHPKQKVKNERGFVGSWIYVVTSTSYSEELAALTSTISCFEIVRTFLPLFLNGTVTCIADWLKLWEL
jgi:hypothetical protein